MVCWPPRSARVRGEWTFEDPRIFDKAGVNALIEALRAARPDLAAKENVPESAAKV